MLMQASVAELAAFKKKMSDREAAIQNAAKKQLDDMDQRVHVLVKRLDATVGDLETVRRQAGEENSKLTAQIAKVWSPKAQPRERVMTCTCLTSYILFSACVICSALIPSCTCATSSDTSMHCCNTAALEATGCIFQRYGIMVD